MLKKRWVDYIFAYLFWAISLALAVWFLILARNTFPNWIANSLIPNPVHARPVAVIIDRLIVLGGGFGWLAVLIIVEQYFRKGVAKGILWRRIARVIGILLVLIFLADGSQMIQGLGSLNIWLDWLLLIAELALGVGLLYLSVNRRPSPPKRAHLS